MMLEFFKQKSLEEIKTHYAETEQCLSFLAEYKWSDGFVCRHCGHTHYCQGKKPYSRRCTKCKREESATAATVFHHCRMPLPEAFFLLSSALKNEDISIYDLSLQVGISHTTCSRIKKLIKKQNYERTNSSSNSSAL